MTGDPINPPESIWASVIPSKKHAGEERPDLWLTWLDILNELDRGAAARLEAALRDPLASEGLVAALMTWEATDGAMEAVRSRHGIPQGAVASRIRNSYTTLPDESATSDLVVRVVLDATEIEDRLGIVEAKELKRAARAYAGAVRRLRDALVQAEVAAPKAKARPPDPAKAARLRLAVDLCRALGGETDAAFWEVFTAVWKSLEGDDPDKPDPPDKQTIRKHLRDLLKKDDL